MQVVPSTSCQCIKFSFQGSKVTIPTKTSYDYNMLTKTTDIFVLTNRESIEFYDSKLQDMGMTQKLKNIGIGGYQIEPMLLITSLPLSPYSYGRPSADKRPSPSTPWMIYDGIFVQVGTPLYAPKNGRLDYGHHYSIYQFP